MDTLATSSSHELVTATLALLPVDVAGFAVGGLSGEGVVGLLATVRDAQRALDGLVVRLGLRADELAESGDGGDARDVLVRGVRGSTARRETGRVRVAARWPKVGEALTAGAISADHVDSLARRLSPLSEDQQTTIDVDGLVAQACRLPADTFDTIVKRAVDDARGDGGLGDTEQRRAASEFRHWYDAADGMGRFRGALDPERYEQFTAAIEAHMNAIASQESEPVTKNANLAARALHELVTGNRDGGRPVPAAGFIIDYKTLTDGRRHDDTVCETVDGRDLPVESVGRLLCDAVLRRIVLDERGVPIDVGRRYRTATDAQWAATKAIYSSCGWAGCSAPISWCQLHHIHHWERGGTTDLPNLVPLCSHHHHLVHEGGWTVRLLPDRRLEIRRPDRQLHTITPTPTRKTVQRE
jgi:hypothetical protein